MCVIMFVEKERPTEEMVEKAFDLNCDGGGVAWREGDGYVHWKKNLEVAEMQKLCAELPLPYVAHFRIASSGGKRPELCHPFLIDSSASIELEGRSKNPVLFHNGDWREWRNVSLEAAIKSGKKIPAGKWSDSRAMAWLCSIYGFGFMEFIDQKGVAFGPKQGETQFFIGSGWVPVDGVWCSNNYFVNRSRRSANWHICRHTTCNRGFNLNNDGYCQEHAVVAAGPVASKETGSKSESKSDSKADGSGGAQAKAVSPFQALMIAEQQHKEGKLSRNQLKKFRRAFKKTKLSEQQFQTKH